MNRDNTVVAKKRKKKKSRKKLSVRKIFYAATLFIVVVIALISLYRFASSGFKGLVEKTSIAAFGVSVPSGYTIHGIDISHHQKAIDWGNVAAVDTKGNCIRFAFIKATEGITRQDLHFNRNWKNSKKAGLVRGAYHYYYPTRDAIKQAENFINEVELVAGDLPPVLDIEVSKGKSKEEIVEGALLWCKAIEEHYGVKPIIYTNPTFYEKYLKDDFEDYPLWIAHYYKEKPRMQHREWIFWQHTDCATINGIDKPVDLNVFNGDLDDLLSLCIE